MKKIFFTFLLSVCLIPQIACCQSNDSINAYDNEYSAALEQLMSVSGAKTSLASTYPVLMQQLKEGLSEVPEEVMQKLEDEFRKYFFDKISELYLPIYKRYFTLAEIKEYAAFFDTPLGRKVAMTTPSLMKELYEAGREAGIAIARKVLEELKAKGYPVGDI